MQEMNEKKAKNGTVKKKKGFFKKHPIGGMVIALILISVFGTILQLIPVTAMIVKGYDISDMAQQDYLPWIILEAIIALLFYCKVSGKNMKSFFSPAGLGYGIMLGWSVPILVIIAAIISLADGMVIGNVVSSLALALVAGIGEELMFRLIPLAVMMDAASERKTKIVGCVITSVAFGLIHATNLFAGADPTATLLQVIYAAGLGLLFAGIYVKTKNIWVTIILHTFMDFMSFVLVTDPSQQVTGVISQAMSVRDTVITIIGTVVFYINAIMVLRKITSEDQSESCRDVGVDV